MRPLPEGPEGPLLQMVSQLVTGALRLGNECARPSSAPGISGPDVAPADGIPGRNVGSARAERSTPARDHGRVGHWGSVRPRGTVGFVSSPRVAHYSGAGWNRTRANWASRNGYSSSGAGRKANAITERWRRFRQETGGSAPAKILRQRPDESHEQHTRRVQRDMPWRQYYDKEGNRHFKQFGRGRHRGGSDCPQSDSAKRTERNKKKKLKAAKRRMRDAQMYKDNSTGWYEEIARRELEAAENDRLAAKRHLELACRIKTQEHRNSTPEESFSKKWWSTRRRDCTP